MDPVIMDPVGWTYLDSLQVIRSGSYGYILFRDTRPTIKVQGTENNIRDYNIEDWPRLQVWESYILVEGTLQATSLQSIYCYPRPKFDVGDILELVGCKMSPRTQLLKLNGTPESLPTAWKLND